MLELDRALLKKLDVQGPRYTSYPTAPEWESTFGEEGYQAALKTFGESDKTLSLYLHIPFCFNLCRFCGCSVLIRRKNEGIGNHYIEYLLKEADLVLAQMGRKPVVKQLHLGGGTPTFLTEQELRLLIHGLKARFEIDFNGEIAIEIDPRTVNKSKLETLKKLGFNRLSMGIQDFDEKVQENIDRHQPFEQVKAVVEDMRELGFKEINFDLIYGLPYQTQASMQKTLDKVIELTPDRIAFYSFAYVPWLKSQQKLLHTDKMPEGDNKMDLFLESRNQLLEAGYIAIAMDHFARENDSMTKAYREGKLYRNFMGYTVKPADEYIGLGITSIGFIENTFIQNIKELKAYEQTIDSGKLPITRGKALSKDDQIRRYVIQELMCHFEINKTSFNNKFNEKFDVYFTKQATTLKNLEKENLIELQEDKLKLTELGKLFVRNVAMAFDWYLQQETAHKRFSRTV